MTPSQKLENKREQILDCYSSDLNRRIFEQDLWELIELAMGVLRPPKGE